MPKPLLQEPRFDWRGGRNTNVSPDLLNATELVDSTNARIGHDVLGAITKRTGSRRLHASALTIGGAHPIQGVTQWDAPSGKQVVAIVNGELWYRNAAGADFGAFTRVAGGIYAGAGAVNFMPFRAPTSGAPLVLYIACGGTVASWDGTTQTEIDGTNSVPTASLLKSYHTRSFAVDTTHFPKTIFWGKVGDATTFTTGLSTDGGSAMVDVLSGDKIQAIETVGASLLIATRDSIARFTGFSSNDIQIAQDTAGISADAGCVGPLAFLRTEQVVAFYSDRGAYVASEAGVQSIGFDVESDFDNTDRANITTMCIGHNRQRREIWYALPYVGDGGLNKHVLIYNYRIQNWYGPFVYPFGITSVYPYVDASGQEWFMAGCADGFIRHLDIGALDDVLSDGTGGSAYTMTVELAPYVFQAGPGTTKSLRRVFVEANLPNTTAVTVNAAVDNGGFTALNPSPISGLGATTQNYRLDASSVITGRRLRLQFTDNSTDIPIINGCVVQAFDMLRPAT